MSRYQITGIIYVLREGDRREKEWGDKRGGARKRERETDLVTCGVFLFPVTVTFFSLLCLLHDGLWKVQVTRFKYNDRFGLFLQQNKETTRPWLWPPFKHTSLQDLQLSDRAQSPAGRREEVKKRHACKANFHVRQISMLFIDNKISLFLILYSVLLQTLPVFNPGLSVPGIVHV